MSVHKKLQKARLMLQARDMKKTGYNTFSKYAYFQLADFMPAIMEICQEVGLCGVVSFANDYAILTVVDVDNAVDKIVVTSPLSEANLKGSHPIQSLGAVETYQRRYLWATLFEIVEHDALDSAPPVAEEVQQAPPEPPYSDPFAALDSAATFKELQAIFKKAYSYARAIGNDKAMTAIKAHYDPLKAKLIEKPQPAGQGTDA